MADFDAVLATLSPRKQRVSPRGQQKIRTEKPIAKGRVPRISYLMALAIQFEGMLRDGLVCDQTELAKLAHVTQPRMTQIMNLLLLAPDIQEQILFLDKVMSGKDPVHEKMLRPVVVEVDWVRQREMWVNKDPQKQ